MGQFIDKYGFRTFHATYMNEKLKAENFSDIKIKPGEFI